jgi:hypothetical protein
MLPWRVRRSGPVSWTTSRILDRTPVPEDGSETGAGPRILGIPEEVAGPGVAADEAVPEWPVEVGELRPGLGDLVQQPARA